ncbi:MAG: peptidylprolyl isomerase [Rhizobiaceae bacterium]
MAMKFNSLSLISKPLILVLVGSSLAFSSGVFAQESVTVAKVGDRVITKADLDQAIKDMGQQFQNFPEAERRARALDSIIDINVLAIEAQKAGLDKDPEINRRIQLLTARALHNGYFQSKIQPSVTDESLKARFDAEITKTKPEQEVSARHILVKTEEEAKAIIKELDGGADFIELAKTKSTGPSGPKGGDLGFFGKGRMVPAFEAAAYALEKGNYTKTAVKTQFGFHIIKVDDKRDRELPTFEASKDQLRQVMLTEAYAKAVKAGRTSVGVTVVDESLKLPEVK